MSRMAKINKLIHHEISNILQFKEVGDPRLEGVTITYADVSPDLRNAKVGFSVLSDDRLTIEKAQNGLDKASRYIRKLVAGRVVLRHNPELRFVYDDSIARGSKMDQLIDSLNINNNEEELES